MRAGPDETMAPAGSGTLLTGDPDTGCPDLAVIEVRDGTAGRHLVFRPLLDDDRPVPIVGRTGTDGPGADVILRLARLCPALERKTGAPVAVDWKVDPSTGEIEVVGAPRALGIPERATSAVPSTRTRVLLNVADPEVALRTWHLPYRGVGLARIERIVDRTIGIHPMAFARFDDLEDEAARARIEAATGGHADRSDYFVERLSLALGAIAASRHPDPVFVRTSDPRGTEFSGLAGGAQFEPAATGTGLEWRGAARYLDARYREAFGLECRALRRVREHMGFRNVVAMVPFCRTPEEADRVLAEMERHGLARGRGGLEIYLMAEVPSNFLQAGEFVRRFDGFAIGPADLAQLVLGVHRDAAEPAPGFDERSPAVRTLIRMLLASARSTGRPVGICCPSLENCPEFLHFLIRAGLDWVSVDPGDVHEVIARVAAEEAADPQAQPGPRGGSAGRLEPGRLHLER